MAWQKSQRKLSSLSFVPVNSKPFFVAVSVKWAKLENVWFQWLLNVASPLYVGHKFCTQDVVGWHNDAPTLLGTGLPLGLFSASAPSCWSSLGPLPASTLNKVPLDPWLIVTQSLQLIWRTTNLYFHIKKALEWATGKKRYFLKLLVTRRPPVPHYGSLSLCVSLQGTRKHLFLSLNLLL